MQAKDTRAAELGELIDNIMGELGSFSSQVSIKLDDIRQELRRSRAEELLELFDSDDGVGKEFSVLKSIMMEMRALLVKIRGEQVDIPRLACILPEWDFELSEGLTKDEQSAEGPKGWKTRLREWEKDGFRDGKKLFTKTKRLFLVCADSYRLVPCGSKGQGYKSCSLRTWAKWATRGASMMLEIFSATLGPMVAARLPSTILGGIAAHGLESAQEKIVSEIQSRMESSAATQDVSPVGPSGDCSWPEPVSTIIHIVIAVLAWSVVRPLFFGSGARRGGPFREGG